MDAAWNQPAPASPVLGFHALGIRADMDGYADGDSLVQTGTELTDSISSPQYSAVYQRSVPGTSGRRCAAGAG